MRAFWQNFLLAFREDEKIAPFQTNPPANRGIGTKFEKNLPKRDIKMFPNVVLFKNRIAW